MKKFEQPKIKIATFTIDNIVAISGEPISKTVLEQGVDILSEEHSISVKKILQLEL